MVSDTKRTCFPQASSAIELTVPTELLARMHSASIERARSDCSAGSRTLCTYQPYVDLSTTLRLSVVEQVTTLTVFSQQLDLLHRDRGQQTFELVCALIGLVAV